MLLAAPSSLLVILLAAQRSSQSPVHTPNRQLSNGQTSLHKEVESPQIEVASIVPFADLVKSRPRTSSKLQMRNYARRFSQHPKIQKIDLHNTKKEEIAQAFLDLRGDAQRGKSWNRKMTSSIKQHLQDNNIDAQVFDEIGNYYQHARGSTASSKYRAKVQAKDMDKYRQARAISMKKQRDRRSRVAGTLVDRSLQYHLRSPRSTTGRVPYSDVVDKAVALNRYYSSAKSASWALRHFLTEHQYPEEEIKMAIVERKDKVQALEKAAGQKVSSSGINLHSTQLEPTPPPARSRVDVSGKRMPERWWDTRHL